MKLSYILPFFFIFCISNFATSQDTNVKQSDSKFRKAGNPIDIDSLYQQLAGKEELNYEEIQGQFTFVKSDSKSGEFLAEFIGKESKPEVSYLSYSDDRSDAIIWNKKTIKIKYKLNPTSIKIYRLLENWKQYVLFTGKGQSASGTGQQITFFILLKVNAGKKITHPYEFESRFGSVKNLFDFNKDGNLDYFKISNARKQGEYLLTIHNIISDQPEGKGGVLLRYELNDKFSVLENKLQ